MDYAGQQGLSANTKVIGSYRASQLAGGSVTRPVNTTAGSFLRTQVLSSTGAIIATSNSCGCSGRHRRTGYHPRGRRETGSDVRRARTWLTFRAPDGNIQSLALARSERAGRSRRPDGRAPARAQCHHELGQPDERGQWGGT